MKTKPLLIILAIVIVITGVIYFARSKSGPKTDSSELVQFLNKFNNAVSEGNTLTLLSCFEPGKRTKTIKRFVNLLTGKSDISGKDADKQVFSLKFDIDHCEAKSLANDLSEVTIPAKFSHDSLSDWKSVLTLKIRLVAPHKYKIIKADARRFLSDYASYESLVRNRTIPEKDIFSPVTLAAFKAANDLKARYDSVIWFDHIDDRTYFYVIKGALNFNFYDPDYQKEEEKQTYQMGLVGPDLKEIIPADYDLVHNIGGTIEQLVEVEKEGKRGFYNLNGKIVVPVIYNQVIPLNDAENLALLKQNDDYFYLKKDTTISEKITGLKLAEVLPKFKTYGESYTLSDKSSKNVMEFNTRDNFTSIVVPPSYLVDLQILPKFLRLPDPLRHNPGGEVEDGSKKFEVNYYGAKKGDHNWLTSIYYSVVDHFIDGRSGMYEENHTNKVLVVDEKENRILGFDANNFLLMNMIKAPHPQQNVTIIISGQLTIHFLNTEPAP